VHVQKRRELGLQVTLDVLPTMEDAEDHNLARFHAIQNVVGLKWPNSRATQFCPFRRCFWKLSDGSEHFVQPPKIDVGVRLSELQDALPIGSHEIASSMGGEPMPHRHRR
jgi:hypothetical protein